MAKESPRNPKETATQRRQRLRKRQKKLQKLENAAVDVVSELTHAIYRDLFGIRPLPEEGIPLQLDLRIKLDKHGIEWIDSKELNQIIRQQLIEMESKWGVFQDGRVYCHLCESSHCEHSGVPHPDMVFGGYLANGRPVWMNFIDYLMDAENPYISELFDSGDSLIAVFTKGRYLKRKLLAQFGRSTKTYDILSQVVFGYVPMEYRSDNEITRREFAITVQAVESRYFDGRIRLDLNTIGFQQGQESIAVQLSSGRYHRLNRFLKGTVTRLKDVENQLSDRPDGSAIRKYMGRVPAIMTDLARSINQMNRQDQRRTRHAVNRRDDGRPIQAAAEDVTRAKDESIYFDTFRKTVVVSGPKNRVHIFTPSGRHVTSLKVSSDELSRKITRNRWRPMKSADLTLFRDAYADRFKS